MAKTCLIAVTLMALLVTVIASDPDLTTDFKVPIGMNASVLNGSFFTFTGLRDFSAPPGTFALKKASLVEFPALDGLGVSAAILDYNPGTTNPPHTHPRGTELLYVLEGSLFVGVVDTTGKLFTQTVKKGDLFVFPKGLVHFQFNKHANHVARALSSFSSANAGTVSLPKTLFGSGISDDVLEKAFEVSPATLAELQAPFAPAQ